MPSRLGAVSFCHGLLRQVADSRPGTMPSKIFAFSEHISLAWLFAVCELIPIPKRDGDDEMTMKDYSYYVARVLVTDDLDLRKKARKMLADAGVEHRKVFPYNARGKAQCEAHCAKIAGVLEPIGLGAICNEGFSMASPF